MLANEDDVYESNKIIKNHAAQNLNILIKFYENSTSYEITSERILLQNRLIFKISLRQFLRASLLIKPTAQGLILQWGIYVVLYIIQYNFLFYLRLKSKKNLLCYHFLFNYKYYTFYSQRSFRNAENFVIRHDSSLKHTRLWDVYFNFNIKIALCIILKNIQTYRNQ